jgi:endonuclease YncB( thermonuclease family)
VAAERLARAALLAAALALSLGAATWLGTAASGDPDDAPRPGQEADVPTGQATQVKDGDSFVLRTGDGTVIQVRIAGIDAPEAGQAWADASRRHLSERLSGCTLRLSPQKIDPFGRTVAAVHCDERDVGLVQLRAGLAWHFRRYAREQAEAQRIAYADAEAKARSERIGLWQDERPLEPWKYREQHRRAAR